MFANLLALPFIVIALVMLYVSWEIDSDYAPWMIPPVLATALVYIFSPQINWWWYARNPPEPEPGLRALLERFSIYYRRLDSKAQQRFRHRVALYRMGTDWMPMAWPDDILPPDVQLAIAAQAVTVTLHREEFLFKKFEKIIVYPKPFPSPEYLFAHASELHAEDGCLLFSAEQVMQGFTLPMQWYNVALHEYAKAYIHTYPDEPYPNLNDPDGIWEQLEAAGGMPRAHIESVIGIAGIEPLPVAIHHYFSFPKGMKKKMPEVYGALAGVFGEEEKGGD